MLTPTDDNKQLPICQSRSRLSGRSTSGQGGVSIEQGIVVSAEGGAAARALASRIPRAARRSALCVVVAAVALGLSSLAAARTADAASAVAVSAGTSFSCALLSEGSVDCWGRNIGDIGNNGACASISGECTSVPVAVSGLPGAVALSAGWDEACAILSGGNVDCWGASGDVTGTNTVVVSGVSDAIAVGEGGSTGGCAVVSGGSVECWGNTTLHVATPLSGVSNAVAVSVGRSPSSSDEGCVLLSDGGRLLGRRLIRRPRGRHTYGR